MMAGEELEKDKVEEKKAIVPAETEVSLENPEKLDLEKDVITDIKDDEAAKPEIKIDMDSWKPKTSIGKMVKSGEIKDIDEILDKGYAVFEAEIVDVLLPGYDSDLLLIGQAKGKFGGGQRRVFRQTQKKTPEGNNPSFCSIAVVGDRNGHVGVGRGKSKDTVPAREKALRKAKINIRKIKRGCGSWQCSCQTPHSIPFKTYGECGSVKIELMPAPKGKGLVVEPECAKILRAAGIKDVWSRTFGQTKVKINLIEACINALDNLNKMKIRPEMAENVGLVEGSVNKK